MRRRCGRDAGEVQWRCAGEVRWRRREVPGRYTEIRARWRAPSEATMRGKIASWTKMVAAAPAE